MSMIKRWLEHEQNKYAQETFLNDGCPEDESKNMEWEDLVEHFFENDYELAMEAFMSSKDKEQFVS